MQPRWFTLPILILASGLLVSGANKDCVFLNNPNEFAMDAERIHKANSELTSRVAMVVYSALAGDQPTVQTLDAATVPRKNFIDDAIFNRMAAAGIQSAPIASDAEFLRRVTLDLTGRIPSGGDVVAFMFDTNQSKREAKIDPLIGSPGSVGEVAWFFRVYH